MQLQRQKHTSNGAICRSMLVFTMNVTFVLKSKLVAQLPAPLSAQELLPSGTLGVNRSMEPVTVGVPLADSQVISNTSPQLGLRGAGAGQVRVSPASHMETVNGGGPRGKIWDSELGDSPTNERTGAILARMGLAARSRTQLYRRMSMTKFTSATILSIILCLVPIRHDQRDGCNRYRRQ